MGSINYREQQYMPSCQYCFNCSENNTCIGITYHCTIHEYEEVSQNGICDKYDSNLKQQTSTTDKRIAEAVDECNRQISKWNESESNIVYTAISKGMIENINKIKQILTGE